MSDTPMKKLGSYLNNIPIKSQSNLLPALLKAQELFNCVPEEAALLIAEELKVPPVHIYGMLDFYSLLYKKPLPETVVQVCTSPVCSQCGSEKILKELEGKTDSKLVKVEAVQCLGLCSKPPSALVNGKQICNIGDDGLDDLIAGQGASPDYDAYGSHHVLTKRFGKIDLVSLADYIEWGGFEGLKKALSGKPETIITAVKSSGLLGRGGAAFPTGLKEESTAREAGAEVFVICNADESEPGTFKDRILLNRDPYSVLEGMIITAYVVGARQGFIYIRGEYKEAQRNFLEVMKNARSAGYLGKNILGSRFDFDIELRSGAGAYICGEETALFESIEGKRGYPRNKPPYPVDFGLLGKPTDINNVETFGYVSHIMEAMGREKPADLKSTSGTRLFCLSGDLKRPGLFELPFGVRLSDLISKWGGGMKNDREAGSVILGGASGSFVPPSLWDIPLDNKSLKEKGLSMGSGVIMVFDETRGILSLLEDITGFFHHESCGKCYPCRLGTKNQFEIIRRIAGGDKRQDDKDKLTDIGFTMKDSSLCGLGQSAASAVLSAINIFPELF